MYQASSSRRLAWIFRHLGVYILGRQIGLASTSEDEISFLDFVRAATEIQIAETAAPSKEDLWVDGFSDEIEFHRQYWIGNKAFKWKPKYGRVNADAPDTGGWYYIENIFQAPVVEFSRTDWSRPTYGRLYWAKDFAAPDGLDYDVQAFSLWYDDLARWIRKNGRKIISGRSEPYFLPAAQARHFAGN